MAPGDRNEVNYLDLVVLSKLDAESTVEKFGSQINTSFFETANLLGTMKIKGLLDIQSAIGGRSPLVITGEGRDYLTQAAARSQEPLDTLDQAILHALAGGVRGWPELVESINIRSLDLAFHLYKLKTGDYIDHEVRSGKVSFSLTEKGFNVTGGVRVRTPTPGPAAFSGTGGSPASGASASSNAPANGMAPSKSVFNPPATPSSPAKPASSIEDEIRDILNFGGFMAPKKENGKNQPTTNTPSPKGLESVGMGAKSVAPMKTATPASSPISEMPSASPASGASSTALSSASAYYSSDSDSKLKKLDRTTMLLSKIEYYAQNYWTYALMVLLLIALVLYALLTGIFPHQGP